MAGSIAGAIAGQAAGALLGGGGGGGSATINPRPFIKGFSAGGIGTTTQQNGIVVANSTPQRKALINRLSQSFIDQAGQISSLSNRFESTFNRGLGRIDSVLDRVKPGFGELTKARVDAILNRGQQRQSDLRADIAKRRILGSSFGQNLENQLALDIAQQEAEARAVSTLEELDITNRLLTQKTNMEIDSANVARTNLLAELESMRNADGVKLDEMNRLAQIAGNLTTTLIGAVTSQAQTEAALAAEAAAGRGAFSQSIAGDVSKFLTDNEGFNDFFGGLF